MACGDMSAVACRAGVRNEMRNQSEVRSDMQDNMPDRVSNNVQKRVVGVRRDGPSEVRERCVSVIVPVFNAELYLGQCLESLLAQRRTNFELLLVDNGSRDRSVEICRRYAQRDARIRLLHCPTPGASAARNFGLDHATGDYVVFVDADDWVEPDHLENLVGEGLGHAGIAFVNAFLPYELQLAEVTAVGPECFGVFALLRRQTYFGWTWNKIFDRAIIERYGIRFDPRMRLHEDELFTSEYCRHVRRVRVSNRKSYHYRIHPTSVMRTPMPEAERLFCYGQLCTKYGLEDGENRYLSIRTHLSLCCRVLRRSWWPGDVRMALAYVRPAYEAYRGLARPEFLRDDRDRKVAWRSSWEFRFRNGIWIWAVSRFLNI